MPTKRDIESLVAVPSGKVVDFVTGLLLNDTPEEYVRQNIAMSLVLEYGYDRSQLAIEFKIKIGSSTKRIDIGVFKKGETHLQENIHIIVETKRPGKQSTSKDDGVDQLKSYMAASLNCEHGLWTNGEDRSCYRKFKVGKRPSQFLDALDIPVNGASEPESPTRKQLHRATGDNLLFAFRRCHNFIAGNQGLQKPEAFWELLKVIFCKIEDERSSEAALRFYVSPEERFTMNGQGKAKSRTAKLFAAVKDKYNTIFSTNEEIDLNAVVLSYVIGQLQSYSLLNTTIDVKGVAYEEIVGSNLRGDRGEFFTPRNACRMAVDIIDPQPSEVLLDPACGTGGFLVIAMQYALTIIESKHKSRWHNPEKPNQEELSEYFYDRSEYLKKKIFGIDLNPNLVRAAKMNMVMNNDGSGTLVQTNSLEHPHIWDARVATSIPLGTVDIIVTNPPFGTKIRIDDPRVLAQYDVAAQWDVEEGRAPEIRVSKDGIKLLQSASAPEVLFVERCLQWLKPGGRMAIVLPNGLLNNPGLEVFRHCILDKAQLVAVIDMHRDLFQPNNDTQTSMVIFRKWKLNEDRSVDYPIFMAVAETVGHDKRGATIFKRNPDGSKILKTVELHQDKIVKGVAVSETVQKNEPIVDDELGEVPALFRAWLKSIVAAKPVGPIKSKAST